MEVDIEFQRTAEALDQVDCARLGGLAGVANLVNEVRGDTAVDDAQHPPHHGRKGCTPFAADHCLPSAR